MRGRDAGGTPALPNTEKRKPGWLARLLLRRVGCGYITARRDRRRGCFCAPQARVHRSKRSDRQENRRESACKPHAMHLSVSALDHKLLFLINLGGQRIRGLCPLLITYGGCDSKVLHNLHREDVHSESAWRIRRTAEAAVPTFTTTHISLRPSMAFSIVISSVYSMSLPTGIPMAMRVTFTPTRFNCCER